jgi:hypothetical protein
MEKGLPGAALPSRTCQKSDDRSDRGAHSDSPVRPLLGPTAPPLLCPGELTATPLFLRPSPLSPLSFPRRSSVAASLTPLPEQPLRLPPLVSQCCHCLSSCAVSTAIPGAGVHVEAPLPGDPPLLSAATLPTVVRHRCALRPPLCRLSA